MSDERFWSQLLQFIDEQRVVPILGRELLDVEVGDRRLNLYAYLAERLAARLEVDATDLPPQGELNEVACRFMNAPGRRDLEDVYAELKLSMPGPDELAVPDALLKLAEIRPLKLFVSTTFDPLLVRALNQVRFAGKSLTTVLSYSPENMADLACSLQELERPLVFHLLGQLSPVPEFALTDEDTLEFVHALQSRSRRPGLLFDELKRQQLLIIGSHFPDWLARFFIRAAAGERLSLASGKRFLVDEQIRGDRGLRDFLTNFSMRTHVYQQGDAVEFIDELHQRWLERHPEASAAQDLDAVERRPAIPAGAVFLSYASEDIEAATRIRDALEGAGVDVWFDKEALKGGHDFEAEIRRNIDHCSVFIPLMSHQSLTPERRFFRIEWNCALDVARKAAESQKFIVPVCIDDTPTDAPEIPEKIGKIHWDRFNEGQVSPEWIRGIRELYRAYQKWTAGTQ